MNVAWYYAKNGQQVGPVNTPHLRQLIAQGAILGNDLVWKEGFANWVPAQSVAEISAASPAAPAPAYDHAAHATSFQQPLYGDRGTQAAIMPQAIPIDYYTPQRLNSVEYAGFWMRFAAAIIDGIITGVAGFVLGFAMGLAWGASGGSADHPGFQAMSNVLGIVISWLYCVFLESSTKQATLGKMALGLRVTDLNGERIGFGRATGRHFAKIISGLILGIGYMMAGWTERKQALHDSMAGCLVIRG